MEQFAPVIFSVQLRDAIVGASIVDQIGQLASLGCAASITPSGKLTEILITDEENLTQGISTHVQVILKVRARRGVGTVADCRHEFSSRTSTIEAVIFEDQVSAITLLPWGLLALAKRVGAQQRAPSTVEFFARGAHEIRTPLTAILAYVESLKDVSLDYAAQMKILDGIRINGRHLLELIDHVLVFSRLEVGQLEISRDAVDIHVIFDELLPLLERRAAERRNQFILEYSYPIPRFIRSDAMRLRQVLLNLIGNAIKFTEDGSVAVVISYREESEELNIDIVDTGVGIARENLERVFEPFAQADAGVERKFGGAGLGLAVTQGLLQALGGRIAVTSTVGQGSIFSVTLPGQPVRGELVCSGAHQHRLSGNLSGPGQESKVQLIGKVLIADDTAATRELLEAFFRQAGAEVHSAKDGVEAVQLGKGEVFDLIVMDAEMPNLSGYGAMRELRQHGVHAPILAVTAHLHREELQKCMAAGATQFLSKASSMDEILFVAEQYIGVVPTDSMALQAEAAADEVENKLVMQRAKLKFLERFERSMLALESAVEKRNWKNVKRIIHPLSSAKMFGFVHVTEELREIAKALHKLLATEKEVVDHIRGLELLAKPLQAVRHEVEQSLASSCMDPSTETTEP